MANLLSLLAACAVAAFVSFIVCRIIFSSSIGFDSLSILGAAAFIVAAVSLKK